MHKRTIVACATALPAHTALLRVSGPRAIAIATAAGLPCASAGVVTSTEWTLLGGTAPTRRWFAPAGRSFTGCDLVEIALPGSRDLIALALAQLHTCGAESAPPGGFAWQALANGQLTLDQAEAILAMTRAPDEAAAAQALVRLRGALAADLTPMRTRLIELRAVVEAGLDFLDEHDVRGFDPQALCGELAGMRTTLARWLRTADSLGDDPVVCLIGPANAGKSALFARLTGAPALVSPIAGTTRDWLTAAWRVAGRTVTLIDTAGWFAHATDGLDTAAVHAGQAQIAGSALVLVCSAPDAPLPDAATLPERSRVIATKSDLGRVDARACLAVSAQSGAGLDALATLVGEQLAGLGGEPRQQRLLREADAILAGCERALPADELLADDLGRCADALGDIVGRTTSDDVLAAIFARFCIGK